MLILILHKRNDLWARVRVGVRIIRVRDRVVPLVPVWPESLINITSNVLPVQAALEKHQTKQSLKALLCCSLDCKLHNRPECLKI